MDFFLLLVIIVGFIVIGVKLHNANKRIEKLEGKRAFDRTAEKPEEKEEGSEPSAKPETPETQSDETQPPEPSPAAAPAPQPAAQRTVSTGEADQAPAPTRTSESTKRTQKESFEFAFGGKIFTGIGALALIVGLGFLLKYAFDNNLITEKARVIGGGIVGMLVVALGAWLERTYRLYGQIVTGTGLAIMYLSVYGAYALYGFIPHSVAVILMFVVTVIGVWLAVSFDSQPLATFAGGRRFSHPVRVGDDHQRASYTLSLRSCT